MSDQSQSRTRRAVKIARGILKGAVGGMIVFPLAGNIIGYQSQLYTLVVLLTAVGAFLFARRWNRLEVGHDL